MDPDTESLCTEVARRVMGWTSGDVPWAYDGVVPLWHTADGHPLMTRYSWQPDRNDAQNLQVLDRMIDLGFELDLAVRNGRTVVRFSRGPAPVAQGEDGDRRIALLRAALAAATSSPDEGSGARDTGGGGCRG